MVIFVKIKNYNDHVDYSPPSKQTFNLDFHRLFSCLLMERINWCNVNKYDKVRVLYFKVRSDFTDTRITILLTIEERAIIKISGVKLSHE